MSQQRAGPTLTEIARNAKEISTILGDVVGLMTQFPAHANRTVSDVGRFLVPPILLKQIWIAEVPIPGVDGVRSPIAAAIWIEASDAMHQKLLRAPKFTPGERDWRTGPHIWVIDYIGRIELADDLLRQMKAQRLAHTQVNVLDRWTTGKPVAKVVGEDIPRGEHA